MVSQVIAGHRHPFCARTVSAVRGTAFVLGVWGEQAGPVEVVTKLGKEAILFESPDIDGCRCQSSNFASSFWP